MSGIKLSSGSWESLRALTKFVAKTGTTERLCNFVAQQHVIIVKSVCMPIY